MMELTNNPACAQRVGAFKVLKLATISTKYYNTIPNIRTKKENIKFSLQAQNSI